MSHYSSKIILIIGATGAQGTAVIDGLLKPAADGTPSPYVVRALTRDLSSKRAQALAAKGVELSQGSFMDFASVSAAMKGAYGAFVNTDGFTVGEAKEIFAGMRLFELAKEAGLKHFVWSSAPYALKLGGYDPKYNVAHANSKARVTEWLKQQESDISGNGLAWTSLTMGVYLDMIKLLLGPLNVRADGTRVFANPLSKGPLPLIALADLAFWVRYSLENREKSSGQDFHIASDLVTMDTLPMRLTAATGLPATYVPLTVEEWMSYQKGNLDRPMAGERKEKEFPGDITWREDFTCWWHWGRDSSGLWPVDMEWVRSVHPGSLTFEEWVKQTNWDGKVDISLLKNVEGEFGKAGESFIDIEKASQILFVNHYFLMQGLLFTVFP